MGNYAARQEITWEEYYHNLSPIETRLFKEGYWKFSAPSGRDSAIIFLTEKWSALARYCIEQNIVNNDGVNYHKAVTMEQLLFNMDKPKAFLNNKRDYNPIKRLNKNGKVYNQKK